MAELGEYGMTHAPPNNAELALLDIFIDQRVAVELLRHKTRMFDLLHQNTLIERSVVEHQFRSRILSMYAETMATLGVFGVNRKLESSSIGIREGQLKGYHYVAIVSVTSKHTILRGQTRNTRNEAMESFIDTVLRTGQRFKAKVKSQRDEYNEAVRLGKSPRE